MQDMDYYQIEYPSTKNVTFGTVEPGITNIRKQLIDVAMNGLGEMFDPKTQLFYDRVVQTPDGYLIATDHNLRYSLISLLGLYQFEIWGGQSPINISRTLQCILDDTSVIKNGADAGLLLWLTSLVSPEKVTSLYLQLDIDNLFNRFSDAKRGETKSLGWLLTGLSFASMTTGSQINRWSRAARSIADQLIRNYGGKGIFYSRSIYTIGGILKSGVSNFVDQINAIYGLTVFSTLFDSPEAREISLNCAINLAAQQGESGQWWWEYKVSTGKAIRKYPIFSAHQYGLAPMALAAIGKVTGVDFKLNINKGLQWVAGNNECFANLIDSKNAVIWSGVKTERRNHSLNPFKTIYGIINSPKLSRKFVIPLECRPSQLGWLLYALSPEN
ncbi:MAG: hypothetical protein H6629_16490 [Calditrichae bacterium]|nr:hypothetical protein [Calditrichia bacterium]